jgi:hypothetical protein
MKRLFYRIGFCLIVFLFNQNIYSQCFFTSSPSAPAYGCYLACEDVVWKDILNSVATGNSITKNAGGNNWNAGAASTASVFNNGHFETVVSQTNTDRMFGLSSTNPDANYTTIQFAFFLQNNGQMRIYESGADRGGFGAYSIGDTLRVRVLKKIIHYYRNSTLIYKSTVTPTLPLIADISLYTNTTATLQKAVIVNVSNGDFTATSTLAGASPTYQWKLNSVNVGGNSPNYSNTSLAVNDVLICNLTYGTAGCSTGTVNSNQILIKHTTISYFGNYYITSSPSSSACQVAVENVIWDTTAAGTINNSVTNNTITKLQSNGNWDGNGFSQQFILNNGYMQTTVAETNLDRMIGLSATDVNSSYTSIQYAFFLQNNGQLRIYQSGADIGGFGAYAASDVLKIANENNVIKYYKNGQALYISSVVPSATLFVDVSIEDVGGTANDVKIANGQVGSFNAIVISGGPAPSFQWKLNSINVGSNSSSYSNLLLNNNDAITCVITPSLIGCLTNTALSSAITITNSAFGTINDFYLTGVSASSACKEALTDVSWRTSSITNNTVSTNNVTKIQSNGIWDGNAFSYQSVNTNGYMQTTVAEINRDRMIGLSSSDGNSSYTSIQFAFFLQNNGQLRIYQSGADIGGFGAYAASDVLKIANENNVIKYYKNGQALYISSVVPSATLFVDVSIEDVGGTATNVKVSNGNTGSFSVQVNNAGPSPTYQWKLNNVNVGSNVPSYTNTALANNDVVTCVLTPSVNGCSASTYTSNQITIGDINQTALNEFYISGTSAASACKEAVQNVVWRLSSITNNTTSTNNVTKIQSDGVWDGNAFSYQAVNTNGYMQTTVAETNRDRMIGLSATDASNSFASIQYAFFLQNNGQLRIYQSGADIGGFGAYAASDVLKIANENNVIKYYINNQALYISGVVPSATLFVDVSIEDVGGTATNVKVSNGNISTFTAVTSNAGPSPTYQWKLNNVNVGSNVPSYTNTTLANTDVITCVLTPSVNGCSASTYTSNQITIGDINQTLLNELYITGTPISSVCKEAIEDVVWRLSSITNNTISTNNVAKIQSNGVWDGNAFSYQSVTTNGYMQTTVAETNRDRMIGLSSTDGSTSFASIQFAFFLQNNGQLRIYQSGADIGGFGAYAASDVLKIANENNVIKYYKNNGLLYTSLVVPSATLFVDLSIEDVGGTASNVKVSNGYLSTFSVIATNAGPSPTYQWQLNNVNVGSNISTYTNTSLANNDVITCVITPSINGCSASTYTSNAITIVLPGVTTTNWLGTTNVWNTSTNWSNGVPDKYKIATITAGTNNPVISTNALVNSITIGVGRSLTISASNTLDVYGNWTNQGSFTPNTSTVKFLGCTSANTISCTAPETFYKAVISNSFNVLVSSGTHSVSNNIDFQTGIVTNSGTIAILDNATATNASTLSHVDGLVKKVGNDAFAFPVGDNNDYQAIFISAPSAVTDQFDAQYFYSNPHPTYTNTLKDASLDHISICEYWILNRVVGTSNVSVSLTWDPNSCGVTSLPDLRVARWNGSMWKDQGNGGTGGSTITGTVVSSGVVTAFSPFTLASNTAANPLPIELLYFNAVCNNNIVTFNWATATEINNDYFVIESSLDGINWEVVATKKGSGTSTTEKKYEVSAEKMSNKMVYYRLKQVDTDGSFDYSKLINVNSCDTTLEDIVIFPNPTNGKLRIMNNSEAPIKFIIVTNTMGQKIYMSRTNFETVDLSQFQDGVYFVNLETEYNTVVKKIIVSK